MNLKDFKEEFDPLISNFINNKVSDLPKDKDFNFLENYFKYLIQFINDGKRIRPFIAFLTYSTFGGNDKNQTLKLLIFIEIFHYFCLIHDDIMDNSSKRHGINTLNKEFGNSPSILLGDFLFSWAFEIINDSELEPEITKNLTKLFSEMITEVFMGQALDIYLDGKESVTNDQIMNKTLLKTAGYTFTKPMLIGLLLSDNYTKNNKESLENLGKNLGLAFQIQDDLLDITSDFDGKKKPLNDITEGKHTLISNHIFSEGNSKQKEALEKAFGNEIDNIEDIRKIFHDSGAIEYAENLISNYFEESKKLAIDKIEFLDLIKILENRKS